MDEEAVYEKNEFFECSGLFLKGVNGMLLTTEGDLVRHDWEYNRVHKRCVKKTDLNRKIGFLNVFGLGSRGGGAS